MNHFIQQFCSIMKKFAVILTVLIVISGIVAFFNIPKSEDHEENFSKPRSGIAILMTGAAARIPQEAALMEELDNRGLLDDLVFISGVSSGALNAIILNGIKSHKLTWNEYKTILDSLKNNDVFIKEDKKLPVNTEPARNLYTKIIEDKLGYKSIGDLPIPTSISFTHIEDVGLEKKVYRMSNVPINEETDTSLNLVDILMASSAFPIVFPPVHIRNVKTIPDVEYVDGGIGEDHVPYQALLEFERYRGQGVKKVYIISRKSDKTPEISEELKGFGINDKGVFDKMDVSLEGILSKGILRRLEAYTVDAPNLVPITYIWIPDYEADFMLFNFDKLEEQYTLTSAWAKKNNPVLLEDYLKMKKEK